MEQINDPTIITDVTNGYPIWQKTIRVGQLYCQRMIDAERKSWLETEALEEMRLGLLLCEALSYYGITVDPPLENRVVIDNLRFSIEPRGKDGELLNFAADALWFDLTVAYELPAVYEQERERLDEYSMWQSVGVRHRLNDDGWQQEHGQLADVIDKVTTAAERFMAKVDGWKAAAALPPDPPPPSLSQQLESVLREIVRDECMKQDSNRRDWGYDL